MSVPAPSTGLTRVTVAAPQRRLDVALPDEVPVAELLPDLLHRAGDGLADAGEEHGGWVLRRVDGSGVAPAATLAATGVRDGEVLYLVPARTEWPEPEYDDVVDAIAAGAGRLGAAWSGDATRLAAVLAAGGVAAVALLTGSHRFAALAIAAVFLLAGVLAARAYAEPLVGAALAGYALPAAFLGGLHLPGPGPVAGPHVLVAGAALAVWAVAGALGVGYGLPVFFAGAAAGGLVAAAGLAAIGTGTPKAAALLLVVVVLAVTVAPLLAVRLGRLPLPVVTVAAVPLGDGDLGARVEPGRVQAAVARADAILTGMLIGYAGVAAAAAGVLSTGSAGWAGLLLVGVAGAALLLRARLFVTVRHRVPLLAGGLLMLALPFVLGDAARDLRAGSGAAPLVATALAAAALAVAAAGARYRRRPPSPYLGRAADLLDTLCLVSVIPIAAAILGLYATVRGLAG